MFPGVKLRDVCVQVRIGVLDIEIKRWSHCIAKPRQYAPAHGTGKTIVESALEIGIANQTLFTTPS